MQIRRAFLQTYLFVSLQPAKDFLARYSLACAKDFPVAVSTDLHKNFSGGASFAVRALCPGKDPRKPRPWRRESGNYLLSPEFYTKWKRKLDGSGGMKKFCKNADVFRF